MNAALKICPCCGQILPEDIATAWDADTSTFVCSAGVVRFTTSEAQFFDVLFRKRKTGAFYTTIDLAEAAYAHRADGGPESINLVAVHISRIRNLLQPLGWTITKNEGQPKLGYRLVQLDEKNGRNPP